MTRVAVVGATGRIGQLTVQALRAGGHDPVEISRSHGVDAYAGTGLTAALDGVDAVVDASNTPAADEPTVIDFFTTVTGRLQAAEQEAGVRHHVLLSIVGVDRVPDNAHYAGKVAQERAVRSGPVPWTILRATQFHDFAEMVANWTEQDGTATIAPLLVQPVAPADVAAVLAELSVGAPHHGTVNLAGPEPQDLVDMARRTYTARGRTIRLVPTWAGLFGPAMAGEMLLPGDGARIAPTTFDQWLAALER